MGLKVNQFVTGEGFVEIVSQTFSMVFHSISFQRLVTKKTIYCIAFLIISSYLQVFCAFATWSHFYHISEGKTSSVILFRQVFSSESKTFLFCTFLFACFKK